MSYAEQTCAMRPSFSERDLVVYEKSKHGTHPGRRARDIRPASAGDTYRYLVTKYWIIERVPPSGRLTLRTPGGKRPEIERYDPSLRRATWLELLWLMVWQRPRLRALRDPQV